MQGRGHGEKLSRRQEQAIAALLAHPTLSAAAASIGISEVSLWRWMRLPEFATRYREARQQVVDGAIAALQQATGEAVTTLRSIMADAEAPASTRVAAAKSV